MQTFRLNSVMCFACVLICAPFTAPAAEPVDLALGKTVELSQSSYGRGPGSTMVLTDGKLTARTDNNLRADRTGAANFSYPGLMELGVDLGSAQEIGEVAIRFSGGSREAGTSFPVWVKLVASDDGEHYYRVASYSRFTPGDQEKYGVPREAGKAFIYKLRFQNINVKARYVGIEFYGTAYFGTDELWVLSGDPAAAYKDASKLQPCDFSLTGPRLYFHKPLLMVPNNMNAPNPIGLNFPSGFSQKITATIDLPAGVSFAGGKIGGQETAKLTGTPVDKGFTRYSLTVNTPPRPAKDWGRVYLRSGAKDGKESVIRYQLAWGDSKSPLMEQPIRTIEMTTAPQPKRIMTVLCYWGIGTTIDWPDVVHDFKALGFNTLSEFSLSTKFDDPAESGLIAQFRAAGFKVLNVDNSFEQMSRLNPDSTEFHCQFADGKVSRRICPSYRGPLYKKELERIADEFAKARPDVFSPDIELWDSNGPTEAQQCTRCQADFKASGAKSWEEWRLMKGEEMVHDLAEALRARAQSLGIKPPELGVYDFRPGDNYNLVFPFDRLYPKYLDNSQPSTYGPLYPYNVTFVGNESRKDRQTMTRSNVMPWLTPGDAGVFPGEMFTWALLECYANGSRGVHFWSHRLWDAEVVDAHARAVKMVAPVEDVVVDGDLVKGVACEPAMRASGMQKGGEMFLLIAKDYYPYRGTVTVKLPEAVTGEVVDLGSGKTVAKLKGAGEFKLKFSGECARALHVKPAK